MPAKTPPVIGVTGPVAAGKSVFSARLAAHGARVIDVDALGHRALDAPAVREAVLLAFGPSVASADGSLDRRALARIAFADDGARRRLEAIVHPRVRQRIDELVREATAEGAPAIVLDCALLFEGGLDERCDLTVDVDAPKELRLARAHASRGWDADEMRRREAAQLPSEVKRARADRVVVNDADASRLDAEARRILEEVLRGTPPAGTQKSTATQGKTATRRRS